MAVLIDGKKIAAEVRGEIMAETQALSRQTAMLPD